MCCTHIHNRHCYFLYYLSLHCIICFFNLPCHIHFSRSLAFYFGSFKKRTNVSAWVEFFIFILLSFITFILLVFLFFFFFLTSSILNHLIVPFFVKTYGRKPVFSAYMFSSICSVFFGSPRRIVYTLHIHIFVMLILAWHTVVPWRRWWYKIKWWNRLLRLCCCVRLGWAFFNNSSKPQEQLRAATIFPVSKPKPKYCVYLSIFFCELFVL